jgi:hypothetical protein
MKEEEKLKIINEILLTYSGSAAGFDKLQRELWTTTPAQWQRILAAYRVDTSEAHQRIAEIQADRRRMAQQQALSNIFRTPISGKVAVDNQANRSIIAGWAHEDQGEQISPAWFTKVLSKQPQLASQITWQSTDVLDPAKRRQAKLNQEAEDRETFNAFARENGFSEVEANFQLAKSVLEDGFSKYALLQAVRSNALTLAVASPSELSRYSREAAEARQDFLINQATPEQLVQAARQESEQRRIQAQREEDQRQIAAREQKDAAFGFTSIPEFNQTTGEKLDGAYFIKLSNTNISAFRQAIRRWGAANVTARIRGIR